MVGAIASDGGFVTILDEPRLMDLLGWVARYEDLDLSWLPDANKTETPETCICGVAVVVPPREVLAPSPPRLIC